MSESLPEVLTYTISATRSGAVMDLKPRPLHQFGTKNIFCPRYEECLNHAAKNDWEYWNCSVCAYRQRQEPPSIFSGDDPDASRGMSWDIYRQVMQRLGCVRRMNEP